MKYIYFLPAAAAVFWGIISSITITSYLQKRGIKINWFLYRIKIFQYINDYKRMTIEETGSPGFWYYSFTISMAAALFFTLCGLFLYRAFH